MTTSKSMFYEIVLHDRLAVMAQEYIFKYIDSNSTYFNKTKQQKALTLTEHLWSNLEKELDKEYPEFTNRGKTFKIIDTRNATNTITMSVDRAQH